MEEDRWPCSVEGLCAEFKISVADLNINCIFCNKTLTEPDIWSYCFKDFKVVWRKGFPYASCWTCIELQATVDLWRNYECSAYGSTVEEQEGERLEELYIRCCGCLKLLNRIEKAEHITARRHFHRVRGLWRGICLHCLRTPPRFFQVYQEPRRGRGGPLLPTYRPPEPEETADEDEEFLLSYSDLSDSESESSSDGDADANTSHAGTQSNTSGSGRPSDPETDAESHGPEVLI
nr:E6 [Dyodeltapapillomavirus sp.]WGU21309.1 E6 [Firstpapillomavirinae PV-HMU-2]